MVGGRGPVARMTSEVSGAIRGRRWTVGGMGLYNGGYERGELTWMRVIAECIEEVD